MLYYLKQIILCEYTSELSISEKLKTLHFSKLN